MPKLSERSITQLKTCHPDLQRLIQEVAVVFPIVVLEGHRTAERQAALVKSGASKTLNSLHLTEPSRAVDFAPSEPVDWNDTPRFYFLAGYIKGIAMKLGTTIRWGGDWDSDTNVVEERFKDLGHIELT